MDDQRLPVNSGPGSGRNEEYEFMLKVLRFRAAAMCEEYALRSHALGANREHELGNLEMVLIQEFDYPKPAPRKRHWWDRLFLPAKVLFKEELLLREDGVFHLRTHWINRFDGIETLRIEPLPLEQLDRQLAINLARNL